MKIFGIGLPRTGTTSVAVAMLDLGFKTCHTCFYDRLYDDGEAFFDTPIYVDYPLLDRRYPGSKFILTWFDPAKWYVSFSTNLGDYLNFLRTSSDPWADVDRRCYTEVFGTIENSTPSFLISRYRQHRRQAEDYFYHRPDDLLILDLNASDSPWDALCQYLGRPRPVMPFPNLNSGTIDAWDKIIHRNKL